MIIARAPSSFSSIAGSLFRFKFNNARSVGDQPKNGRKGKVEDVMKPVIVRFELIVRKTASNVYTIELQHNVSAGADNSLAEVDRHAPREPLFRRESGIK